MTSIHIYRLAGFGRKPPQTFSKSPVMLGTAPGSAIRFDPTWDKGVAPQHVKLEWNGSSWFLIDLGSSAGTYVGGQRITVPIIVSGPVEFELGQGGQRCVVEPAAEAVAAPASSTYVTPQAAGRFQEVPATASDAIHYSAPPQRSGMPGWLIALIAVVAVAILIGVGVFCYKSFTVTGPVAQNQTNSKLPPLPPRDDDQPASHPAAQPAATHAVAFTSFGEEHKTGLLQPTSKQQEWINQSFPSVSQVKLNAVGRDRALSSGGTFATAIAPVAMGDELVTSKGGDSASTFSNASAEPAPSELPSSVDNSTLGCFPGVGDQGQVGSCASFSTVYYSASHNVALVRGAKDGIKNLKPTPLSPFWTYPQVNGGEADGSLFQSVYLILQYHGAPTLQEYPYPLYSDQNNPAPPQYFRPWCTDPAIWRDAIHNRVANIGKFTELDTPKGQARLKAFLANGYLANYATSYDGWQGNMILSQSDPSLSQSGNSHAGQPVLARMSKAGGGHAMTIVGYDDDIWVDLNGDGKVQPEEKGAFKVVNSWGPSWPRDQDGGFAWISYDALRDHSAVPAIEMPDRQPAFWFKEAWYMLPQADSKPHLLAQFTLSNAHRNEIDVRLGVSTTALKTPAKIWRPASLTITDLDKEANDKEKDWTSGMGGPYPFDGGDKEVPATFVFDLDDLTTSFTDPLPGNQYRFYLMVTDLKKDNPTTISDFKITDGDGKVLAQADGLPKQVDNDSILIPLDCASPNPPPAPAP